MEIAYSGEDIIRGSPLSCQMLCNWLGILVMVRIPLIKMI